MTIIFQYFKLYVKVLRRPFTSYPRSLLSSFHPPDSSSFLSISLFPFHAFIWIGMRRIVQDRPRAREIMRFGCLPLLLLLERLFVLPSSLSWRRGGVFLHFEVIYSCCFFSFFLFFLLLLFIYLFILVLLFCCFLFLWMLLIMCCWILCWSRWWRIGFPSDVPSLRILWHH